MLKPQKSKSLKLQTFLTSPPSNIINNKTNVVTILDFEPPILAISLTTKKHKLSLSP